MSAKLKIFSLITTMYSLKFVKTQFPVPFLRIYNRKSSDACLYFQTLYKSQNLCETDFFTTFATLNDFT